MDRFTKIRRYLTELEIEVQDELPDAEKVQNCVTVIIENTSAIVTEVENANDTDRNAS